MDYQGTPFSERVKQPTIGGFFIILLIGAIIGFQLGRWSNIYERRSNISPTTISSPSPTSFFLPSPTVITQPKLEICVSAGCSGELCVDKSQADIMSTCEYKEDYACLKYSRCERQSDGQCDWTQTPEYSQCLSNIRSGF